MNIIITLIVVGFLLYLVNVLVPMDGIIKKILNAVVIIGVVIWLLRTLHMMGYVSI